MTSVALDRSRASYNAFPELSLGLPDGMLLLSHCLHSLAAFFVFSPPVTFRFASFQIQLVLT
jgi:hypothetical protein